MEIIQCRNDAHSLIIDYVECAKYVINLLREKLPDDISILRGKVLKLIPQRGEIDSIRYEIHGKGCYFEFTNWHIDIDMGVNDCYNCFDAWKLFDFLMSMDVVKKGKYKSIMSMDALNSQIQELILEGIVKRNESAVSELMLCGNVV